MNYKMNDYKFKLKKWYDETAERYDSWGQREGESSSGSMPEELRSLNKLLYLIEIKKDTKILDVATGTGIYLIASLKRGGIGYGIDISKEMLKVLRRKLIRLNMERSVKELRLMDASSLKYHDNLFDLALCIGLFDYYDFPDVKIFLEEIKRVCKNNSFAIIDFPNKDSKKVYLFQEKERSVGHEVYVHSLLEIRKFLKNQGFEIISESKAGIEIQFLLKIRK